MNRDSIISAFVADPDYRKICKQIAGSYADDLYQELVLIILQLADEKLQKISESCIKCFYYKLAKHQYCSRNSAFHKKYRKTDEIVRDHVNDIIMASQSNDLDPDLMQKVERAVSEVYWYDSGILSLYAEKGTLKEVSECTGIPLKSVYDTVANTRKIIKKKIKKYE
jgi:DNA-directed RNA polymerase specialized sigma24 family protein